MNPDLIWDIAGEPSPADAAVVDAGLDAFNRALPTSRPFVGSRVLRGYQEATSLAGLSGATGIRLANYSKSGFTATIDEAPSARGFFEPSRKVPGGADASSFTSTLSAFRLRSSTASSGTTSLASSPDFPRAHRS